MTKNSKKNCNFTGKPDDLPGGGFELPQTSKANQHPQMPL
jgi:hypothetical protein